MSEIWKLGLTDLAKLTRAGEVSAVEAVASALARVDSVNPRLNAIVARMDGAAIARAESLDKARLSGAPLGALHGVPITIKINTDQAGYATTNGLPVLANAISPANAPVVEALEAAGAVVIGRTNTPEFSFRAETDNPLHGLTHNPWGSHVSAGGSSGGAAAAVMAGMGALAQGNDIAGSLRLPASACGAVTLKPGLNRVPSWNPSARGDRAMLGAAMAVQGPITRSARDLQPAMEAMIRPHAADPFHAPLPWQGPEIDGPIRVGWTNRVPDGPLDPSVAKAMARAREALVDAGYLLEEIDPPGVPEIFDTAFRALMTENMALYAEDFARLGSEEMNGVLAQFNALYPSYDLREFLLAQGRRQAWARGWSLQLERTPLVLAPLLPEPFPAPNFDLRGGAGEGALSRAGWGYAMNYLGLPAGCLPAGIADTERGPVPIGVQVIGRRWREDLIAEAMVEIEARLGMLAPRLWERMGA